jgi:hypothetical protein
MLALGMPCPTLPPVELHSACVARRARPAVGAAGRPHGAAPADPPVACGGAMPRGSRGAGARGRGARPAARAHGLPGCAAATPAARRGAASDARTSTTHSLSLCPAYARHAARLVVRERRGAGAAASRAAAQGPSTREVLSRGATCVGARALTAASSTLHPRTRAPSARLLVIRASCTAGAPAEARGMLSWSAPGGCASLPRPRASGAAEAQGQPRAATAATGGRCDKLQDPGSLSVRQASRFTDQPRWSSRGRRRLLTWPVLPAHWRRCSSEPASVESAPRPRAGRQHTLGYRELRARYRGLPPDALARLLARRGGPGAGPPRGGLLAPGVGHCRVCAAARGVQQMKRALLAAPNDATCAWLQRQGDMGAQRALFAAGWCDEARQL